MDRRIHGSAQLHDEDKRHAAPDSAAYAALTSADPEPVTGVAGVSETPVTGTAAGGTTTRGGGDAPPLSVGASLGAAAAGGVTVAEAERLVAARGLPPRDFKGEERR